MKQIYLLALLALVSLACMATNAAILPETNAPPTVSPTVESATAAPDVRRVIADTLNIRDAPSLDGDIIGWLLYGDTVTVLETSTDVNGVEWCRHAGGWSACRWMEEK